MLKTTLFLGLFLSAMGFAADPPQDWTKYSTPGENHKKLAELAGKWNYTIKWWMSPDAKAEESKGKSSARMVFGNRFLHEQVTGKMGKDKFEGAGLTGFDTMKNEFQGTWADSMGTSMMFMTGTLEGDTMKMAGTMSDPMTGEKDKKVRTELKFVDKNTHTYAMFTNAPDGKEFKAMEIEYKRAK